MSIVKQHLQTALAETAKDHGPGVFGLVTQDGRVSFAGTAGVADVDRPRPIASTDRFRIGSITTVYVATLVLQLVADGALRLDDTVDDRLPGLVPEGGAITVEMLLRLRSGLPDYNAVLAGDPPTDLSALDRYWSPAQVVAAALTSSDRLSPGSRYRYCNTDYILLGMLIEQATGQRVDAQLWQRIIKPLGLNDTTFPTVDPILRGPHAKGYIRWGRGRAIRRIHLDDAIGVVDRRRDRGHCTRPGGLPRRPAGRQATATRLPDPHDRRHRAPRRTARTRRGHRPVRLRHRQHRLRSPRAVCPATPVWPCGPNPGAASCSGRTASTCTTCYPAMPPSSKPLSPGN